MASRFLLEVLIITIIVFSTIVSGEDSSITLPLEDGETYHSILPISGETANPYRLAVIGDSIAWGNGLNQEHKYYNLVAKWLRTNLGKPVEIIVYAHSGAVISDASGESVKNANLNSGYPPLMEQAKKIPNNVDLILISGGINDVGIGNILDPKTSVDTIKDRYEDILKHMKELLMYLMSNTKPDAKIIVTGYYPLITDDSKLGLKDRGVGALLARGSDKSVSQDLTNLAAYEANPTLGLAVSTWQSAKEFGLNLENIIENDPLFKANSYNFYGTSSDCLRAAVNDVNKAIGGNRVVFVDPLFQSNNGYRASESYLWEFKPGASIESNDEQYDERSILTDPLDFENKDNALCHPNVKGASRYADAINQTLKSKKSDWFQSATATKEPTSAAIDAVSIGSCKNTEAQSLLEKGEDFQKKSHYEEAIQCFDQAIQICQQYTEAWSDKGATLSDLGKYDEAINACDKALELDPNYAFAWNNKGIALYRLKRYDESLDACDKALELDPQLAVAWSNKGAALSDLGRYDEAIDACDNAIELDPNYDMAWNNKGNALFCIGRYDESIQACDRAIELNPDILEAWNNKALALSSLGRYDEALQACDKAIELNPDLAITWNTKSVDLNSLSRYDEALQACDKALELDPQFALAWSNKGLSLIGLGQYDESVQACEKAIELDQGLAEAWNNKALALSSLGRYDEALQACDKATELNPGLIAAWNNKGIALEALGKTTEANIAYAKASELG